MLKQLVAYVGLEAFLAGLRDYFRDHAFGNATFGDLLGALEKSSGRDLSRLGPAVAQDHRPEHAARGVRRRRRRPVHPVRDRRRAAPRPAPANPRAPARGRHLRRRRQPGKLGAGAPRGARRRAAQRTEVPALRRRFARQVDAGQRRRPDLLLAAARPGVAADRAGPASPTSPSRCRARWCGRRPGR